MLSAYRVNYYQGTTPKTAYVVASSEQEASAFMGVRDGSAQVSTIASPVEVAGLSAAHAAIAPIPVNIAPPAPHKQLSDAELVKLRAILAERETVPATKS